MLIKIFTLLGILLFIWVILFGIYNALIYPIIQLYKRKNESGYVLTKDGQLEHRSKVEKMIGRRLHFGEEVHHINGKVWHNKRSNLALMTSRNHKRWHGRLQWMFNKKMFPSIKWQRKKLIEEFGATLF